MHVSSAASWVAQSPERIADIDRRARELVRISAEDHFRRLILDWAASDEGSIPTRREAHEAAMAEIEVVCRALGRMSALAPEEVFPHVVTTPVEVEGW